MDLHPVVKTVFMTAPLMENPSQAGASRLKFFITKG